MSGPGVTEAPYLYIETTGVIVPDTADLQTEIENEYTASLGEDFNVEQPTTPQGTLIQADVLVRNEVVSNNAAVANQINPNISGGICLEAICALTGLDPPPATNTIVEGVSVGGVPNTIIPAGSSITLATGDVFLTTEAVTLVSNGTTGVGTVDFEAQDTGPVACPIGAMSSGQGATNTSGVLGWETANNSSAGILGNAPLTDAQLRALRNNSLALQGSSLAEAITSALAVVPGVLNFSFRENYTGSDATIDGIFLVKNSVWACVNGGTPQAVAQALLTAKSGGCNWNGANLVGIIDPSSGQTYNVKYDIPAAVAIMCQITVVLPGNVATSDDVKAAIVAYAAGTITGQPGFITGGNASPFGIAGAVISQIPGTLVQNCELALAPSGGFSPAEIDIALNQIATLAASDIAVTVLAS